jgi:hypothetical protein
MATLRTYSNPAEAAIAKSVLDDRKILCSLADENVNLYGGGPLAMPIRLLVAEGQAEEAARILKTKARSFQKISSREVPRRCRAKREISTSKFSPRFEDFIIRVSGSFLSLSGFVVVGGFAIRAAGYVRRTMDIDLVIDTALNNEALVYEAYRAFFVQLAAKLDQVLRPGRARF